MSLGPWLALVAAVPLFFAAHVALAWRRGRGGFTDAQSGLTPWIRRTLHWGLGCSLIAPLALGAWLARVVELQPYGFLIAVAIEAMWVALLWRRGEWLLRSVALLDKRRWK